MSNNNSSSSSSSGVGFFGLLFIVFLVLKLTHVIDWSWWWITSPLWGIFAIILAIIIMTIVGSIISVSIKGRKIKHRKK